MSIEQNNSLQKCSLFHKYNTHKHKYVGMLLREYRDSRQQESSPMDHGSGSGIYPTTTTELQGFLAIILNMGLIELPHRGLLENLLGNRGSFFLTGHASRPL